MEINENEYSLKPCPFCGSKYPSMMTGKGVFYVECQGCDAAVEKYETFTLLEAANEWNNRPIEDALKMKVERLEKAIWEFQDSEYSHSPEEIQEYLDEIYTGKLDERFDKVIAECKKDWE